jgi:hypothetical protein
VVGLAGGLTTDEVGQALGRPVVAIQLPRAMGVTTVQFVTAEGQQPVLMLQESDGGLARAAWRVPRRAQLLPGLGEEAWVHGERGALRAGDRVVLIVVIGGRADRAQLGWLLQQAAARLTRT